MRKIFVTGIDTGIGKTVAAAVLTEALEADYWKPVQVGDLDDSDSMKVQSLLSNEKSKVLPEGVRLKRPMSPHAAAELEQRTLSPDCFDIPESNNPTMIIEGAGGLMVPLSADFLILDLIRQLKAEVVLVSKNYLGSINHTLLTAEMLRLREIPVLGIIFNGEEVSSSEQVILEITGLRMLGRINREEQLDKNVVLNYKNIFEGI